ncbi:MAG: DoxX family protein [Gammaproteobacteria bacterium]
MQHGIQTNPDSKLMLWTGRVIVTLAVLFFLFDSLMKLIKPEMVVKATGWPEGVVIGLGVTLLVSTVLYAIPRSSVLGAILITCYLGGAVAVNLFLKAPVLYICLAVVYGILLWGGLFLRDPQLRAILPVRS